MGNYDTIRNFDDRLRRFSFRKGQVMSGYTIGILLLDVWYPILPGNVACAATAPHRNACLISTRLL